MVNKVMVIVNAVSIQKGRPELDARLKSSYKKSSEITMMSKDFNKEDSATTERVVGRESSKIELLMERNRKTLEMLHA